MEDIEEVLSRLVKKYEDEGFNLNFHIDDGQLVCGDNNHFLGNPVITVHERLYCPADGTLPHGFCLFALSVEPVPYRGLFLLPEGFYRVDQVPKGVNDQLQLSNDFPQIFKL